MLLGALPGCLDAQGYRLQVDARFQAVGFRGVQIDSVPVVCLLRSSIFPN